MDPSIYSCASSGEYAWDNNETTTCGDADEVSSLCSWATDQDNLRDCNEFENYPPAVTSAAPGHVGISNVNSSVWGYGQGGDGNSVNNVVNNVPVSWPIYGTYMPVAVPVMCYIVPQEGGVFTSDEIVMPLEAPGPWNGMTVPVSEVLRREEKVSTSIAQSRDAKGAKTSYVDRPLAGKGSKEPERTTIILRNLPLECTRDMLLHILDSEGFWGCYNFLHLPVDFQTKAGLGYALLNLVSGQAAARVKNHFSGFSSWPFPSDNVCSVAWNTPQQGLSPHIERYRNSPLMHASVPEAYRPVLFKEGVRVRFPGPTARIRAPRIRHAKPGKH